MQLQTIKLSQLAESPTNPRGKKFEDASFDELVASVKEKGVLVPIIARHQPGSADRFEVVAGNRRYRAAKYAGLMEIPASIQELNDIEAREVQIIENLQRQDVHPLDEGEAYRALIEKSGYEIQAVAAKVAKSESYVKQRLFLTNLEPKVAQGFRAGRITDGHAVLIARLSPRDQRSAYKECTQGWRVPTIKDLKAWIEVRVYEPLKHQPWLHSEELRGAVGTCQECPPATNSLFGDVTEGACTDLKCWARKMEHYIKIRCGQDGLLKISAEYGTAPKGILSKSEYTIISAKAKDRCAFVRAAIVAAGDGIGTTFDICADAECEQHGTQKSHYLLSPEEKAKRKKEREKHQAQKAKEEKALRGALAKVTWPPHPKTLHFMLEMGLHRFGSMVTRPIAKRHEWQPKVTTHTYGDGVTHKSQDWEHPIREAIKGMTEQERLQLLLEIMLESSYGDFKQKLGKAV